MKMQIILLFFVFAFAGIHAQETNIISGKIADSATREPVSFATVSMVPAEGTGIINSIADSLGNYAFRDVEAGNYRLVINAVGYDQFQSKDLQVNDTSHITGILYLLSPEKGLLTGVRVRATRPLLAATADGFTYTTANDMIAAGTTAAELLRKIPMLSVDQNGVPVLRGSTNIRVYIDDKPSEIYAASVADALRQLPAEDIVRVEVILYPSAKYDAEGTDGVINIITRQNRFDAINGTLTIRPGNLSQNFSGRLNLRRGKWILNVNNDSYIYRNKNGSTQLRDDASGTNSHRLSQETEAANHGRIFYSGINIMYAFNDRQVISAGYRYKSYRNYNTLSTANRYDQDDRPVDSFTRNTGNVSGYSLHTVNVGYNGKSTDRRQEYSVLAMYFSQAGLDGYDLDQLRQESTDYRERFRSDLANRELSLQADYLFRMNDRITWDAGAKYMSRQYGNVNKFDVFDAGSGSYQEDGNRSNHFSYDRDIYAGYGNINVRFKSWQARAGIRYEQTTLQTGFKDTTLSVPGYKNFIPSVVISKTIGEKHVIKYSYGKRITRPYLNAVSPAVNYSDSFNIQSGNPQLQPETTNRFELGYTFTGRQAFLAASLYYNGTHNGIEQVRLPFSGGIFWNTYQNIGKNDVVGLSLSLTWKWKQKLNITSTINLRRSRLKSTALQPLRRGNQAGGNLSIGYVIGKGYSIEAAGNLSTPDITLQGKREQWKYYSFTFNKKFKGDRINLSLRMDNFLPPAHQYLTQTWSSPLFHQTLINRYRNQYYWLAITWKFGKKEVKAPTVRQEAASEN